MQIKKPTQGGEIIAPNMNLSLGITQTCCALDNNKNSVAYLILNGTTKEIANCLCCCSQTADKIQRDVALWDFLKSSVFHFAPSIEAWYKQWNTNKSTSDNPRNAGRNHIDPVSMFFLIALADVLDLSYEALISEVTCNVLLRELVNLDPIPSPKPLFHYYEIFNKGDFLDGLFLDVYEYCLDLCKKKYADHPAAKEAGLYLVIDGTFRACMKRRNHPIVNAAIKQGIGKEIFGSENIARQKDTDATWSIKRGEAVFGYKDHIAVEPIFRLVRFFRGNNCQGA